MNLKLHRGWPFGLDLSYTTLFHTTVGRNNLKSIYTAMFYTEDDCAKV